MSEFAETMHQARRMCAAHGGMCSANDCPLNNEDADACRLLPDHAGEGYVDVERVIMDWAKEHPEPVYPTWEEGWKQLFPDAKNTPCPDCFGIEYRVPECAYLSCADCKSHPMPADVAEKLGIKPIAPIAPKKPATEHDGCGGCKWYKVEETDEPCVRCAGTTCGGGKKPDLWEAAK